MPHSPACSSEDLTYGYMGLHEHGNIAVSSMDFIQVLILMEKPSLWYICSICLYVANYNWSSCGHLTVTSFFSLQCSANVPISLRSLFVYRCAVKNSFMFTKLYIIHPRQTNLSFLLWSDRRLVTFEENYQEESDVT